MPANPQLKLKYAFISDPNPIRASAAGANPNIITLQVMISNPHSYAVTVQGLEIQIPVGHDSASDLSADENLPSPIPDPTGEWQFSSSGGTVTIKPAPGNSGEIGGETIVCTLPGIQVNTQPSAGVPVTITEFYPSDTKVSDANSYSLVKQEANFPVTNFYAYPNLLNDQDETVTLYWECSNQGAGFSYGLRSPDLNWQPKDCLGGGDCFSCQDGSGGVQTPALASSQGSATFTFYLDVIQTDSGGGRSLFVPPLKTTVRLDVPSISQNSYMSPDPSGPFVSLHWLALNSGRCRLLLNNMVIDNDAPTDTYRQGYPVALPGLPGQYQFTVIAYAASGKATASFPFHEIDLSAPSQIRVGGQPYNVAVTPDSSLALVANNNGNNVTVIDIAQRRAEPTPIPAGSGPIPIAITPDGSLALVANNNEDNVTVIDIAARQAEPQRISVGQAPNGLAITPDGTLALVANGTQFTGNTNYVTVIDIPQRQAEPNRIPVGLSPVEVAVTPDGKLALVANSDGVTVIDIATRQAEPKAIPLPRWSLFIAITPDGKLALVTSTSVDGVLVIDIAERRVEPEIIPTGNSPWGLKITPDGAFAVVANYSDETVTVIDIAARKALPNPIAVGLHPAGVAITPDGVHVLVTNLGSDTVTLI